MTLFSHLKKLNKIQIEVKNEEITADEIEDQQFKYGEARSDEIALREERIVDEAFDAGFEKGREFEREDIKRILGEKDELV